MAWNKRYPLILNPNAKSERARRVRQFIMEHSTKFVIYATKTPDEALELSRHLAQQGESIIIAAGGDGTINTTARGLIGSQTALGILPTGTMNVFARELGIPCSDLPLALEVIRKGHRKPVDVFQVNSHPFLQMAGIGFDAQIIEETLPEHKKTLGPLAYGLGAAKILGEHPPKMLIQSDSGKEIEGVCILVGNGCLYGGQFKLFGKANNSDHLMDVLIFKTQGYRAIRDFLKGLSSSSNQGITVSEDSIEYLQTSSLVIQSDRDTPYEVDGEYIGKARQFHFTATRAESLQTITPEAPIVKEWQEALSAFSPFMPWNA